MSDTPEESEKLPNDSEPLKPEDAPLGFNIAAYKKAIEEEFNLEQNPELADPQKLAEQTRKTITQKLPVAISEMVRLIEHGSSDNVRYQASKFLIEASLGDKAFAKVDDPMQALIDNITAKPQPTPDEIKEIPTKDMHSEP